MNVNKRRRNKLTKHWWSGSATATAFVEPTAPATDIVLKFNLYALTSMFQERAISPGGVPVTAVTTNGNPIGTILDQSLATTFLRATGATTLPLLSADGITFDGVNDIMEVPTSTVYLKALHAVGAIWSIRFWIKCISDGAAKPLINNQGLSATQNGFYIQRTLANKIRIFIGDGTAPFIADYTSTKTLLVADGAVPVQIIINGAASKMIIGSTTETFTASVTEGSTNNATQNFRIGGDGTATFFNGSFSRDIMIVNRIWTAQEITDYQSYNPAVSSVDFTPIKQWDLDFNDPTYIFSDAGETTQITNGGFIRSIKSKVPLPNISSAIARKATSASDAASPLWRQAQRNGKSTAEWDGTGIQNLTYSENLFLEVGGVFTFFIVVKNDDPTFGSHYINGDPNYATVTGSNYVGAFTDPYAICHHGGAGGAGTGPNVFTSLTDDYNIIVIRRKGDVGDMFAQTKEKNTLSGFGRFESTLIGNAAPAGGASWDLDGMVCRIEKYMGCFTVAQVNSKIDQLRGLYGISSSL